MPAFQPVSGAPVADPNLYVRGLLAIETGFFNLNGQAVTLRKGSKVQAGAGSYALTGNEIAFTISTSQAGINQVLLTGSTSNRVYGFTMTTNFVMTAGDTKTLVISVKDASGNPVNITDASIKWQAGRSFGKASSISKATGGSGISITDAANGVFTVTLNPSDTESLKGTFYHEAQVTGSDSAISTVISGTMKINPALIESTAT